MRILIIDDSKSIQKMLTWRLEKHGHKILATGSDGNEGIALYKTHKPELVLLDITMPNKDGRECLKEIIASDPKAKVIMLSALGMPEIVEECLKMGALAFIDKNQLMLNSSLEKTIDSILDNRTKNSA